MNGSDAASQVTFKGATQTTYSCVNNSAVRNCDYDVHVLSTYHGNGYARDWFVALETGNVTVDIDASGARSDRAVVLVLLSHHPIYWTLNVPSGLTIAKVLLVSHTTFTCTHSLPLPLSLTTHTLKFTTHNYT